MWLESSLFLARMTPTTLLLYVVKCSTATMATNIPLPWLLFGLMAVELKSLPSLSMQACIRTVVYVGVLGLLWELFYLLQVLFIYHACTLRNHGMAKLALKWQRWRYAITDIHESLQPIVTWQIKVGKRRVMWVLSPSTLIMHIGFPLLLWYIVWCQLWTVVHNITSLLRFIWSFLWGRSWLDGWAQKAGLWSCCC